MKKSRGECSGHNKTPGNEANHFKSPGAFFQSFFMFQAAKRKTTSGC